MYRDSRSQDICCAALLQLLLVQEFQQSGHGGIFVCDYVLERGEVVASGLKEERNGNVHIACCWWLLRREVEVERDEVAIVRHDAWHCYSECPEPSSGTASTRFSMIKTL